MLLHVQITTTSNHVLSLLFNASCFSAMTTDDLFLVQCAFDNGLHRFIAFSLSQMVLDIVDDLLSVYR